MTGKSNKKVARLDDFSSPLSHVPEPSIATQQSLLSHLRHELRTPLNAIIGYSEMALEDIDSVHAAQIVEKIQQIHAAGIELLDTLNKILDPLRLHASAPEALIGDVMSILASNLRTPITNIVGYSQMVLEYAADNGQQELSDDFSNIRTAAQSFISIIESIPHRALVGSTDLGVIGRAPTTILFPVLSASADVATAPGRILVVDDTPLNRDLLRHRLERDGHHVVTADDGREALERLGQDDFDVVLLDVIMPEVNGLDVLAHMKEVGLLQKVAVIMISALDEVDIVVRCIEVGAEDYLTKPFNPVLLKARIGACLEKKRLRDQEHRHMQDIEEMNARLEVANAQLAVLADKDPLTSLFNHRAMTVALSREIERAKRYGHSFSLLFIDLDDFKSINTVYGHTAGDAALCAVGDRLLLALRDVDIAGRWGGEEFIVVLPDTPFDQALTAAERIRLFVSQTELAPTTGRHITCSIGIASYPDHGTSLDALVNAADTAMYRAKNGGRDQVCAADA